MFFVLCPGILCGLWRFCDNRGYVDEGCENTNIKLTQIYKHKLKNYTFNTAHMNDNIKNRTQTIS